MIHMGTVKTYAEDEYKNKPKYVHHHWHTDIAYIKVGNIHYYLIMLLDGYSRFILGWELMTDMTEQSVSLFVQRVKEKYPYCNPMLIMDNGSQFISKDFKILISRIDIKPVHTRRNHPQTNGKIERLNGIVKNEAVKKYYPQNYSEACRILNDYVYEYNYARLHSGINYLRPSDMFFGRDKNILNERKSKLMLAKKCRVAKNKELMEFAS
jgi:transposase InsO family protein